MLHVCRSTGTTSPLCAETRRVSCTHGSCAAVVISRATIRPPGRATSKSWVPGGEPGMSRRANPAPELTPDRFCGEVLEGLVDHARQPAMPPPQGDP